MNNFLDIIFNDELIEVLTPEELIFVGLIVEEHIDSYDFLDSSAYDKLFGLYMNKMPYGTAKARTGDPDKWIINKLKKGMTNDNQT
jgi:hypothetical protein